MKKNLIKKFISFIIIGYVLFSFNNVFAEGLIIKIPASKLIYSTNEPLDISGLIVINKDGIEVPITTTNITGFDSSNPISQQTLNVSSGENTIQYVIEVRALIILSSILIDAPANKINYKVGEVLDISGLSIKGTYSDNSIKNETVNTENITGFNSSVAIYNQVLTVSISGKKATYNINVNPTINLKVYSGDIVLFDGPETVLPCAESIADNSPITFNGRCAVEQSKLSNTWSWYDSSFKKDSSFPKTLGTLDELGGSSSDNVNYFYWGWFSNLNYGTVALNNHHLSNGEELLLTYNSHPLRISASKTSGVVGETISFTAEEESNFDTNYNMIWSPLSEVTVTLGTQFCKTVIDGTCSMVLNSAGSLNAVGSKSLYVPSASFTIEVTEKNSSGGGSGSTPIIKTFSVDNALDFLSAHQNNGSFGSPMYTDWAAIAIATGNNSLLKSNILNYLKLNDIDSSVLTDIERRAMSLMSLGINPYNGTKIDYIKKITDNFDGQQFGDKTLDNDDIFALIVLFNAGYNEADEIIIKDVNHLIGKQTINGSWGSIDMTAAGVEALKGFSGISGVSEAISKAKNYLMLQQSVVDGGFGNSFSTSWVLQIADINFDKTKAEKYLVDRQNVDGGLEKDADEDTRVWATSYAIPAVLHLSWSDILKDFSKPLENNIPIQNVKTEVAILENKEPLKLIKENEKEVIILPEIKENIFIKYEKIKSKIVTNKIILEKPEIDSSNLIQKEKIEEVIVIKKKNIINKAFEYIWQGIKHYFVWLWLGLSI